MRRAVGAIIVKDRRILATGYNGVPTGLRHCSETGCLRQELGVPSGQRHEICRGLHAEQNAIIQAARYGINITGASIYITTQPCVVCANTLINAGIGEIIYQNPYPDELSMSMLEEAGIKLRDEEKDPSNGSFSCCRCWEALAGAFGRRFARSSAALLPIIEARPPRAPAGRGLFRSPNFFVFFSLWSETHHNLC